MLGAVQVRNCEQMLLLLLLLLQLVLFMFVQGAIALWAIVYAFELENCLTTFFGARVAINRFKVLGIFVNHSWDFKCFEWMQWC